MLFRPNPSLGVPIYLQLMEQIKHAVETGALAPGDQLPGIRPLAEELVINPNTVAKAYRELEHDGVIELRHGAGAFVAGQRRRQKQTDAVRTAQPIVVGGDRAAPRPRADRRRDPTPVRGGTGRPSERRERIMTDAFAIDTTDLRKHYGERRSAPRSELQVPAGSLFGFLGRNGAGKTTTIKVLLGFARATAGRCACSGTTSRMRAQGSRSAAASASSAKRKSSTTT